MIGRKIPAIVLAATTWASWSVTASAQSYGQANITSSPSEAGSDIPRAEFIQSMDTDFRKRDLNNDGRITQGELEEFERQISSVTVRTQNQALFANLDADRNGSLTYEEFAQLVRDVPTPDVSGQMLRFDINRDQMISLVEFRTATLANFDRLDTDKDGIVTESELSASRSANSSLVDSR